MKSPEFRVTDDQLLTSDASRCKNVFPHGNAHAQSANMVNRSNISEYGAPRKTIRSAHNENPKITDADYSRLKPSVFSEKRLKDLNHNIVFPNLCLFGPQIQYPVQINGTRFDCIIDTGSQISICDYDIYEKFFNYLPIVQFNTDITFRTADGSAMPYLGYIEVLLNLPEFISGTTQSIFVTMMICKVAGTSSLKKNIIIGTNVFEEIWKTDLDQTSCLASNIYQTLDKAQDFKNINKPIFSQPVLARKQLTDGILIMKPNEKQNLTLLFRNKIPQAKSLVFIEPVNAENLQFEPIITYSHKYINRITLDVVNTSNSDIILSQDTLIGNILLVDNPFLLSDLPNGSVVTDHYMDYVRDEYPVSSKMLDDDDNEKLPDFEDLICNISSNHSLSDSERDKLLEIIMKNERLFSKHEYDIGLVSDISHDIVLQDNIPFKLRNRNLPVKMYAAAKAHIQELLQKEIIRPSFSNFSSAPLFVSKKDGRIRMVTDLRVLNNKTVRDNYALPRLEIILPHLSGQRCFSKIDIRAGYFNIMVTETDKHKTAFSTPFGLYEYNRLPMGAKNSGATFQRAMENILRELLNDGVMVYLDDIICYTTNIKDHFNLLSKVFRLLSDAGVKVNPNKCEFLLDEIKYLGHVINKHGLTPDPDKVKCVSSWPTLRTVHDIQKFCGFFGYFRSHIPNFANIIRPLTDLTKGVKYKPRSKFGPPTKQPDLKRSIEHLWTPECDQARDDVIYALTHAPVLKFPDSEMPYILHIDASLTGISGVLLQKKTDGKLYPVAFASRCLKKSETNYPIAKLEFLALKWAVTEKFKDYLYGSSFTVFSDSSPLCYIKTSPKIDATSQRWLSQLAAFDFEVKYKPGCKNIDADVLSRQFERKFDESIVNDESLENDENFQKIDSPFFEINSISCIEYSKPISPFLKSKRFVLSDSKLSCDDLSTCEINANECILETSNLIDSSPEIFNMPEYMTQGHSLISKLHWPTEQDNDLQLSKVKQAIRLGHTLSKREIQYVYLPLRDKWKHLVVHDSILYKIVNRGSKTLKLIVLPEHLVTKVLFALHNESGHLGTERIISLFKDRFYFPRIDTIISNYVSKCRECIIKKTLPAKHFAMGSVKADRPFECLSMDFLSLEPDSKGFSSVLVVTDVFTKYAFAFPTKNQLASTVAKLLIEKIFNIFGLPERLLSDRGTNFVGNLIKQVCSLMGIKKIFTCPYSPKSDAICERFNRTLINMIGTLPSKSINTWSDYVQQLAFFYNCSPHSVTQFSPFELMFGRNCRMPVDIYLNTQPSDVIHKRTPLQYVKALQFRMETCHELARQHRDANHEANKLRYDAKVRPSNIAVGDFVLTRNDSVRGKHKLQPLWLPKVCVVLEQVEKEQSKLPVFLIRERDCPSSKGKYVHGDRLLLLETLDNFDDAEVNHDSQSHCADRKSESVPLDTKPLDKADSDLSEGDDDWLDAVLSDFERVPHYGANNTGRSDTPASPSIVDEACQEDSFDSQLETPEVIQEDAVPPSMETDCVGEQPVHSVEEGRELPLDYRETPRRSSRAHVPPQLYGNPVRY